MVLCLAMMLSIMVVGAGAVFADQKDIDTKHQEAVDACASLNIITGFENGKFMPNDTVTREQTCKMICVLLNGGKDPVLGAGSSSFSDVANDRWSCPYIESCVSQDIVVGVGGGKFAPAGKVTGSQLAKMLLVALGFSPDHQKYAGSAWEVNVNTDASARGFYKELEDINPSEPLTREHAAQMIWNALNAYEVEYKSVLSTDANGQLTSKTTVQDKVVGDNNDKITLLQDKYEVQKMEAVVVANEYGNLVGNVTKEGKTSVVITAIGNREYAYDATKAVTYDFGTEMDQLGTSVILFAKDTKTVIGSVDSSSNNVIVKTDDDNNNKDLTDLLNDSDIKMVNGTTQLSANYGTAANMTTAGTITNPAGVEFIAIDNDDDGTAEFVIQVTSHFGEVTKYSTSSKGSITVKTANGNVVYNNSSDVVGFADVAKDDYVMVKEIGGKLYINKADTKVGSLSAYKTNDSLTVDGTKYTVSGVAPKGYVIDEDEFQDAASYGKASTLNKEATFYLDNNGYVVAVGKVAGASDDYAFVWGIEQGSFNGNYKVKVTLSDGTTGEYVLTDKAGSIGENMTQVNYGGNTIVYYPSRNASYHPYYGNVSPVENLYTYSINSSNEITLDEIHQDKYNRDNGAFTFNKNKTTIAGIDTMYGDSDTVFFNVEYKNNNTIKKVNVYTGIATAPSIDQERINQIMVSTTNGGTSAAAVVTFNAQTSANGDYLYVYGYRGTNDNGAFYRAVLDDKLMNDSDNPYIYTDSSTQVANGVYEFVTTADGLYQLKNPPANMDRGVITKLSGESIIVNGTEYTVNSSTYVSTIDGADTTVGDKLSKDDAVILVYDVNGSDRVVTSAYIVNASTEPEVVAANGANVNVDGNQVTVTGTAQRQAKTINRKSYPSFLEFTIPVPAGASGTPTVTVSGDTAGYSVKSDNSVDLLIGLSEGVNNTPVTATVTWNSAYTYSFDLNVTVPSAS